MKRDMDLIRELLLRLEELPASPDTPLRLTIGQAPLFFEEKSDVEIKYQLYLMSQGDFICRGQYLESGTFEYYGFRWAGHDYLDAIRDQEVWEKTKRAAEGARGFTFDLIKDLAKGFLKTQIKERTGVEF
jgi:hypothetical protein